MSGLLAIIGDMVHPAEGQLLGWEGNPGGILEHTAANLTITKHFLKAIQSIPERKKREGKEEWGTTRKIKMTMYGSRKN